MRRVVIGIMVVLLVGCVALVGVGVLFGVPLLKKLVESGQDNVIQVMQDSLYQSSSEAIAGAGNTPGTVRMRDRDLTVNNTAVAGEAGWETGTSGTVVYGFEVWFTPEGVHLGIGNEAMYSGVPTILDERLELLDVRTMDVPAFMSLMSADDFEEVIEGGLNEALAAHDLLPTNLTLGDGEMIVNVSPMDDAATPSVSTMNTATGQTPVANLLRPEAVRYENACADTQACFHDRREASTA
ncbi:MAG TPA: hypothetical protein VEW66_07740 [Thermomicrobiales bacterium]|nr:hypothetical protein [Thermomicrobiales bacterium]